MIANAGARRVAHAVAVALLWIGASAATLTTPPRAIAQSTAKSIEGKVLGASSAALAGAIVYLHDEKTNIIKTFIATKDGTYRFGQLPADTDYEIWAEYKGEKSKTRTVSSFDTKTEVIYDFHLKGN